MVCRHCISELTNYLLTCLQSIAGASKTTGVCVMWSVLQAIPALLRR